MRHTRIPVSLALPAAAGLVCLIISSINTDNFANWLKLPLALAALVAVAGAGSTWLLQPAAHTRRSIILSRLAVLAAWGNSLATRLATESPTSTAAGCPPARGSSTKLVTPMANTTAAIPVHVTSRAYTDPNVPSAVLPQADFVARRSHNFRFAGSTRFLKPVLQTGFVSALRTSSSIRSTWNGLNSTLCKPSWLARTML